MDHSKKSHIDKKDDRRNNHLFILISQPVNYHCY